MTNFSPRSAVFVATRAFLFTNISYAQDNGCALNALKSLGLGHPFGPIALQVARKTITFTALLDKAGSVKAEELLRTEIATSVQQHQDKWDHNLADAWSLLLSCQEFQSLAMLKQQSLYAQTFVSVQSKAGEAMQAKSTPLLTKTVTEALARAAK